MSQIRTVSKYGWQRDLPDYRDHVYAKVARPSGAAYVPPKRVDLRSKCPAVYDQGQLGSCTGNAIAGAIEFQLKKVGTDFAPSRLFVYYNERVIEGTVSSDSGAQIRDGIKAVNTLGVCPETEWPYDVTKFTDKPTTNCYTDALKNVVSSYSNLQQSLANMKDCLAFGLPFVFGFTVYSSFESEAVAKSGHLKLPTSSETVVGGHAVLAVGYDDAKQYFIVRNSWGVDWGLKGYFTIPYTYLTNPNLASDFWAIKCC
jgi:C1A family cysteine protease